MIDFKKLKKYLTYLIIGILIVAACVSVVAVLMGSVNDAISKTYATLFWSAIHCLIALAIIWNDSIEKTYTRLPFFLNTLFLIVALSFAGVVLKVWDIVAWETFSNFYKTFATLAFASFHGEILSKAEKKKNHIDIAIYLNYVFIVLVFCLLQVQFYVDNLGDFFYRVLAASSIIDGTLSILVIIFYRLYRYNNPIKDVQPSGAQEEEYDPIISLLIIVLVIYLMIQVVAPILFSSIL